MKTILIWLYLKLSSFFRFYPKIQDQEDLFTIVSGPLSGLSFAVKIKFKSDQVVFNHRILLVPEEVADLIYDLDASVDLYLQSFIRHEILKIKKQHG